MKEKKEMEKKQKDTNGLHFRVYISLVKNGLMAELGAKRLTTLIALSAYMDKNGVCFPSQEELADKMGVSRRTANDWINSLLEFRWNDKPIIERTKKYNGQHLYSVYKILPTAQVAIFDGQIEVVQNDQCEETRQDNINVQELAKDQCADLRNTNMQICVEQCAETCNSNDVNLHNNYIQRTIPKNNIQLTINNKNVEVNKEINNGKPYEFNVKTNIVKEKQNIIKQDKEQLIVKNKNKNTMKEITEQEQDTVEKKQDNTEQDKAQIIVNQFCKKYFEVYDEQFNVRKADILKVQKIVGLYTEEQFEEIVEIAIKDYRLRWSNEKFPCPTLGAFSSWLYVEAFKVAQERKTKKQELERRMNAPKPDLSVFYAKMEQLGVRE